MERSNEKDEEGVVKDHFEISNQGSQENCNIINGNMEQKWGPGGRWNLWLGYKIPSSSYNTSPAFIIGVYTAEHCCMCFLVCATKALQCIAFHIMSSAGPLKSPKVREKFIGNEKEMCSVF